VFLDPQVQADVVFIEPAEDDYDFFNMGALNFWAKDRAVHHGYAAVRASIDASHDLLAELFGNHGIELRAPSYSASRQASSAVEMRESRGYLTANRGR